MEEPGVKEDNIQRSLEIKKIINGEAQSQRR